MHIPNKAYELLEPYKHGCSYASKANRYIGAARPYGSLQSSPWTGPYAYRISIKPTFLQLMPYALTLHSITVRGTGNDSKESFSPFWRVHPARLVLSSAFVQAQWFMALAGCCAIIRAERASFVCVFCAFCAVT